MTARRPTPSQFLHRILRGQCESEYCYGRGRGVSGHGVAEKRVADKMGNRKSEKGFL